MILADFGIDNRKLALLIWLVGFVLISVVNKTGRPLVVKIFKSLFNAKLVIVFLLAAAYSLALIVGLAHINFWHISMLADSIFWFFGAGVVFIMNTQDLADRTKFKKRFNKYISLTIFLDFFLNLYSFNIFVELIALPFISLIVALSVLTDQKIEYRNVGVLIRWCLSVIGLAFLAWSISQLLNNIATTSAITLAESIVLPPLLTVLFLPFVYFIGIYSTYDSIFVSVGHMYRNSKDEIPGVKWIAIKECGLNYWALQHFRTNLYLRFTPKS